MEDGTETFIESRVIVEVHERGDLNGLKSAQEVFSGRVHFFEADELHDADVHGFGEDVLQIAGRNEEVSGDVLGGEGDIEVFGDESDGTRDELRHFEGGIVGILRIVGKHDEQFAEERQEQGMQRFGGVDFGIRVEFSEKIEDGGVSFFAEAV